MRRERGGGGARGRGGRHGFTSKPGTPPPPHHAPDIDYGWTALYAGGLLFNIAYLVLEGALVGWIFLIIETALILAVIAYKLALERPWRRRRKDGGGGGDDGIASVKLGDDAEGGAGSIIALTGR